MNNQNNINRNNSALAGRPNTGMHRSSSKEKIRHNNISRNESRNKNSTRRRSRSNSRNELINQSSSQISETSNSKTSKSTLNSRSKPPKMENFQQAASSHHQTTTTTSTTNNLEPKKIDLQYQVKSFIDDINTHKSRTHFILDSLLNQYNTTLRKYNNAGKKLEQIVVLLEEFNNEITDASKEMSVHAYGSISCRNLGEPIQITSESLTAIINNQKEILKTMRNEISIKIQDKIEIDVKYLRQQISIFSTEYRINVKNFNNCSDHLKEINTKILEIQNQNNNVINNNHDSQTTSFSKNHNNRNSSSPDLHLSPAKRKALEKHTEELKQEFQRHEILAKTLLKFCEDNFESASMEEQRRFSFFHSKQMLILDEFSALAINIMNEAKKLSEKIAPKPSKKAQNAQSPIKILNRANIEPSRDSRLPVSEEEIKMIAENSGNQHDNNFRQSDNTISRIQALKIGSTSASRINFSDDKEMSRVPYGQSMIEKSSSNGNLNGLTGWAFFRS